MTHVRQYACCKRTCFRRCEVGQGGLRLYARASFCTDFARLGLCRKYHDCNQRQCAAMCRGKRSDSNLAHCDRCCELYCAVCRKVSFCDDCNVNLCMKCGENTDPCRLCANPFRGECIPIETCSICERSMWWQLRKKERHQSCRVLRGICNESYCNECRKVDGGSLCDVHWREAAKEKKAKRIHCQ